MNTKFTLKNFRIFDSKGVTLDLKPITLLTGCNSSGKSSVVKSLVLLSDYISGVREDYKFRARGINSSDDFKIWLSSTYSKMNFAKEPQRLLGKFSKVLNEGSDCDVVTMELDMHSYLLAQDVHLVFEFKEDSQDEFLGCLHSLKVSKQNGEVILTLNSSSLEITQSSLLPEFFSSIFERYFFTWLDDIFVTLGDQKAELVNFSKKADAFSKKWGVNIKGEYVNGAGIFMEYIPHYDDSVLKIAKLKILHYLPILKEKLAGTKDETLSFLNEALVNDDISNDEVKTVITEISKLFSDSEEKDFLSWYRRIERESLLSESDEWPTSKVYHKANVSKYDSWCYRIEEKQKYVRLQEKFSKLKGYSNVENSFQKYRNSEDSRFYLGKCEDSGRKEERTNFKKIFEVLEYLSFIYEVKDLDKYEQIGGSYLTWDTPSSEDIAERLTWGSKVEDKFHAFIGSALKEIILETIAWTTRYAGTSAVNVKRLYALSENDEFTRLLRRYNVTRRKNNKAEVDSFVDKWIKKFGVGDHISIEVDSEGLGMTLRLHRDDNDARGILLADCGYGITQLLSVLLNIEVEILESKYYVRTPEPYFSDGWYRPLLKECSEIVDKNYSLYNCTIAIEEPENHLHPRYQTLLADMFYDAYKNYGIHFVIETHSEYLIRRTQVLVAQEKHETDEEIENKCPFATYYVPKDGEPYSLGYRKDGKFKEEFGSGFYDEASNLAFEIL